MKHFFIFCFLLLGFYNYIYAQNNGEVLLVAEEMPRFYSPECEALEGWIECKQCADKALMNYIYKNIRYPRMANVASVEGLTVISFVVGVNGEMYDFKILRDPGAGCGDAATRIADKIMQEGIRWIPGKSNGKNVAVRFKLPVRFNLDRAHVQKKNYTYPLFDKSCLNKDFPESQKAASVELFNQFITKNKKEIAPNDGYPRVWLTCFFDEKGRMTKYYTDAPDGPYREEAIRLIELLNKQHKKWVPATINGENKEINISLLIDLSS